MANNALQNFDKVLDGLIALAPAVVCAFVIKKLFR